MSFRTLLLPLTATLVAPALSAHIVSGRVVDANGDPVANVDIDADNQGSGGDPTLSGDFTDAAGFFAVDVPANPYDFYFFPPKPPVTTHLPKVKEGVFVTGPIDLGTIVLDAGGHLTGRCVSSTGLPIAGINLDVLDPNGNDTLLQGDNTTATGQFSLAVPLGGIQVQFKTGGAVWPTLLAPQAVDTLMTASKSLGDVVMPPGFHLTGSVSGPSGAMSNVDLDLIDVATGLKVFLQNDNTNPFGQFDVVVAAGTYDAEFCPPAGVLVAAGETLGVTVAGPTDVGNKQLQAGVSLTGTVTSAGGTPLAGVDLDVLDPLTGVGIPLCHDNTNPSGVYAVVVPAGTWHVEVEPQYTVPYAKKTLLNQVIAGATVLNATLDDCPFFVNYGTGTAGTGGAVPHLQTSGGTPRPGNDAFAYELTGAVGGAPAFLGVSKGPSALPFLGGTVLIDVTKLLASVPLALSGPAGSAGAGAATFPFPVEIVPPLFGVTVYHQVVVIDPAAPQSFSMSEGMSFTFCP